MSEIHHDNEILVHDNGINIKETTNNELNNEDKRNEISLDVVITSVDKNTSNAIENQSTLTTFNLLSSPSLTSLWTIECVVTINKEYSYSIQRNLKIFLSILEKIVRKWNKTMENEETLQLELPSFPIQTPNDIEIAKWCAEITHYLSYYSKEFILESSWCNLMKETEEDRINRSCITAVEFILQPFPYENIYIPRGASHEIIISVLEPHSSLVWKFEIEDYDINFKIEYLPNGTIPKDHIERIDIKTPIIIHATTRYIATSKNRPIQGSYICDAPGRATFIWENSFSRIRGKTIAYQVQAVSKEIMDAANAAADALDDTIQKRKKEEQLKEETTIGKELVVTSSIKREWDSLFFQPSMQLQKFIPESISTHSWVVQAPLEVASQFALRMFGTSANTDYEARIKETTNSLEQQKSLAEELNGLNMSLLERVERLEDALAKITAERDQERSRNHLKTVEAENLKAESDVKDQELKILRQENIRARKEREVWHTIQLERDALLEEKHRWEMQDNFETEADTAQNYEEHDADRDSNPLNHDEETRRQLEHELGLAEAAVLKLRASLGFSLHSNLTGTHNRLEQIAKEMMAAKAIETEKWEESEQQLLELKQQVLKYRGQKRVLVTELRNLKTAMEGQVALSMAETNEARMVTKRLKTQNELLLAQIRALIEEQQANQQKRHEDQKSETNRNEAQENNETQEIAYTLSPNDMAVLNGLPPQANPQSTSIIEETSSHPFIHNVERQRHRQKLVHFFTKHDPSKLPEVDKLLDNYEGIEDSLFQSLELKYFSLISSDE